MTLGQVEIKGVEQLEQLGKTLKQADATTLRQELRINLRWAVKPMTIEMKDSLGEGLPKAGGLAALFRKSSIVASARTEGRDVGVRVIAQKPGYDLEAVDRGEIHHLVYGRQPWVKQRVTPDLISGPFERGKPLLQQAVLRAMGKTADKITR